MAWSEPAVPVLNSPQDTPANKHQHRHAHLSNRPSVALTSISMANCPKVLVVLTSHDKLGDTGKPTGWYLVCGPPLHTHIDRYLVY